MPRCLHGDTRGRSAHAGRGSGLVLQRSSRGRALGGAAGQIVVTEDCLADEDKTAVHDAVATFVTTDDRALRNAGADVFAYYLDTVRLVRKQGWDLQLPEIAGRLRLTVRTLKRPE
jgi:hypothetical protein